MKIITAVFTLFALLLLANEQATAGELWWSISTEPDGQTRALMNHRDRSGILYPGEYKIRITLYDDDLKCTLRVGTKSSNTNLMKISGPLVVSIERVRLPGEVDCSTIGTITVSNPSTAAVPVLMTLSYGPALTKTVSMLIVQKVAIQSAVASPTHLAYNRGTRVTVNANISRKFLASELPLRFMWRVREGKLCNVRPGQIERIYDTVEASTNWREGPYNDRYSNDLQTEILRGTLCGSGRTIVEITWRPWLTTGRNNISFAQEERQKIMADFSSKSVAFNVSLLPSRATSRIRSRGIETLPPLIIPDPEPPALPNFELQEEKR